MKKLTALVLLSCLAAASVRADVIFQEQFAYTNGPIADLGTNLVGGVIVTNWITHSGNDDSFVNNQRLENAQVARSGDIHRLFPAAYTNSQIAVYASFVLNCTNLPNTAGAYFASFYTNSSQFFGRVWAYTTNSSPANTFKLAIANAAGSATIYPVDLAKNQDYQVVVEWDPATDIKAYLWVNPISQSDFKVAGLDTVSAAQRCPIQAFQFRQASTSGNLFFCTFSNLVVGTTFNDAALTCLSTNAVTPAIIIQPPSVISNFVGSSFSVPTLANGQGLGSLIYRWQYATSTNGLGQLVSPDDVADTSIDASGYDTSTLAFNSVQTSDNGYFDLIVTTPYGLFVTSSITKLVINATPVPPVFDTGPVSQTVFKGATVTFSASVSSPGSVAFTWYSNNVKITAGQVDNGLSSTYTLPNATINFSATYQVAATNDVLPSAGVTSNAVLTVSNPPVVSIAYLRSLVDPNTFLTTSPLTQPYQATGIITSYTNLTSGNTACYFLQDASAGIEIFVTGGATFRPQQGDQVTFSGVLSTFNANTGGLEFYADVTNLPYTSFTINSSGNTVPDARIIPFTVTNDVGFYYLNTNLMGSRVSLTNVYFGARAGTTIATNANDAVTVTNAGGLPFTLQFYVLDQDTTNQTLPAFAYSVTGNLVGFPPNAVLAVTKFSDIVTNPPPVTTIIPTNSAAIASFTLTGGGNVAITGTNAQSTGVYYLLASTDVALPLSQWTVVATNVVNTNGANGAFTFTGTNVVAPGGQQQFYILSNTNSNH